MTTAAPGSAVRPAATEGTTFAGTTFDWAVAALGGLMLFGVHLDAWAHHRLVLETFFTPWHGLLYGGYALLALLLAGRARRGGGLRPSAMPAGYEASLRGAVLFALAGVGDLLWHAAFGIEASVGALLSPPHLLLTFFTAYANPLAETGEVLGSGAGTALGVAGVLVQSVLLSGVVLFAARRFALPLGGLTVLIALSSALMLLVHADYALLPALLAAGLYAWLRPSRTRPGAFRAFATLVPAVTFALAFAEVALTGGLVWSVALAAVVGWLLSFAFLPTSTKETA